MSNIHVSYSSLENPSEKQLERIDLSTMCNAFEKYDGANFSINIFKDSSIRFGSRTRWINDGFYGYKTISDELIKCAKLLILIINSKYTYERIIIFGELFGGYFPGKKSKFNVSRVGRGPYYSPDIEFYAFDICLYNGGKQYLEYDEYSKMFEEIGMNYAKALFTDTIENCLKFNVEEFKTEIPNILFGDDIDIDLSKNYAEGIVIKPVKEYNGKKRLILKYKKKEFGDKIPIKNINKTKSIDKETLDKIDEISQYINKNTLNSICSKNYDEKNIQKIAGLIVSDAIDTYTRDTGKSLPLNNKKRRLITNKLLTVSLDLVKSENIL